MDDGSFTVVDSGIAINGSTSLNESGDIDIQLVDGSGNVLSTTTASSNVVVLSQQSGVIKQLSASVIPVVASLPAVYGGVAIEVIKNGRLLVHSVLRHPNLSEIVAAIPNDAFKFNALASRFILTFEASAIQKLLDKGANISAIDALAFFKTELNFALKDDYLTGPDQLTKQEALLDIQYLMDSLK